MNEKEYNKLADFFYKWRENEYKTHPLKALFFEVTLRCNAKCEHCGSSCGYTIPKDEITKEEIMKVLDDIVAYKKYPPEQIMLNITGGEPLVRKDLFEIMAYADSLGFPWGMTTNGMLITEEIVQKMEDTHMYSVSVSIDGLKETHENFRKVPNSYENILRGLRLMQETESIKVIQVTTCVNKKNIDELEDIYKMLLKLGIKHWRVIEVDPIGRARDNDDILLDGEGMDRMIKFIKDKQKEGKMDVIYGCGHYLGKNRDMTIREIPYLCYAGIYVGCVLSNGDIYVCPNVARRPELVQGNIRKDSFPEVWDNKYQIYRSMTRTCAEKCKNCDEFRICGGDAFHTFDFDTNEPLLCPLKMFKEKDKKETKKTVKKTNKKK